MAATGFVRKNLPQNKFLFMISLDVKGGFDAA